MNWDDIKEILSILLFLLVLIVVLWGVGFLLKTMLDDVCAMDPQCAITLTKGQSSPTAK